MRATAAPPPSPAATRSPAADKGEPATCGHDGTFDYSDAWEDDPAAEERARKKLRGIRQSAAARREGVEPATGPGTSPTTARRSRFPPA